MSLFLRSQVIFSVILLVSLPLAKATATPRILQWSSKTYGPDGPWHAITVQLGTPAQPVDLIPGGSWMSNVLSTSICSTQASAKVCNAQDSGLYDFNDSTTKFQTVATNRARNTALSGIIGGLSSLFGSAEWVFDRASVLISDSVSGIQTYARLDNFDMFVVNEGYITLPDGSTYLPEVGKLSLGAPSMNQTWANGAALWNGTFLPGRLFEMGYTSSNSYSLHIGSVNARVPGSLVVGGFDPSRILGPVSAQAYQTEIFPIDMLDIGIGVAAGLSPFNYTSKNGLLASGNSSIGLSMPVTIDATSPYLYLPQSVCNAIANELPVIFSPKLGLYFWNTTDPAYKAIITSPSFLKFSFRLNGGITDQLDIKVPFALLNLTLTSPLADTPTPYFPCRPSQVGTPGKNYALGRAFLQAAFLGVNWQSGLWYLAQAPGPNTPSQSQLVTIAKTDRTISGSTGNWEDTWNSFWSLIDASNGTGPPVPSTTSSAGAAGNSGSALPTNPTVAPADAEPGMSKGLIAGIAIAVVLGMAGILAMGILFFRRWSEKKHADTKSRLEKEEEDSPRPDLFMPTSKYAGQGFCPKEMDGKGAVRELEEMRKPSHPFEMP